MRNNTLIAIILFLALAGSTYAQNWTTLNTGTDYILFDISFPQGQNDVGYAAGMQYTYNAEGIVLKTTDGGDNWTQVLGGPGTNGIEAICFTSVDKGFIAGWNDYFAKTIDGGATWTEINVGSNNWYFMDIDFWDEDHGIAFANHNTSGIAIYYTVDGGNFWTPSSGVEHNVQDIAYADVNTLYAVGGNESISKSIDGGLTWTQIYSGTNDRYFMGVDFKGDFGTVGGEDGKIFYTADGGDNWNNYATGYHNFQGVHVFNADSTYIGGTNEDIYKTTDGGDTWVVEDNGTGTNHIYKIKFTENNTGFLCGSHGMMKRKQAPEIVLTANFESDIQEICNWEYVHFTDLSEGDIDSWEWTFEGGTPESSTEQNPVVNFFTPGTYDVSLTVFSGDEQATITKEDYISSDYCPGMVPVDMQSISISPNPASDLISIKGLNAQEAIVSIFDLSGSLILQERLKGVSTQLNISEINSGSYILSIEINGQKKQEKIIIE